MYSYRAFGLTVASQVPLVDLLESDQLPDVLIRQRRMQAASLADKHDGGDSIGGFGGNGRFRFLVERGREVWFDYDDDFAGQDMIPSILLGMVFAAVLRQRGFLVLHASCVARDGRAIAFVGDSGSGKSTLAEYFCQQGYILLSDDILAVDLAEPAPVAIPGFPQVKLLPDAGRFLRRDFGALRELPGEGGKRSLLTGDCSGADSYPLQALLVLEDAVEDRARVVELSGHRALLELTRHTRMRHMFTAEAYQRRQVQQCCDLIQRAPVKLLRRQRELERLPETFSCVDRFAAAPLKSVSHG